MEEVYNKFLNQEPEVRGQKSEVRSPKSRSGVRDQESESE